MDEQLPSNNHLSDESDDELDRSSTAAANVDPAARRDLLRLERALQDYRTARTALRAGRSSDYPPVPTASALRAYWHEEPVDSDGTTRPWLPPLTFSSSTGPHRDHAQRLQYARVYAQRERERERERRHHEMPPNLTTRRERQRDEAFARVRNLIRYLSQLRHTGVQGGLELARHLGLDSLYESEEANLPSDLPMHVNSLPIPQYSSWLQPGMVWHGLQSTDREPLRSVSFTGSSARRERQRDVLRRTLNRRREFLGLTSDSLLDDPSLLASDSLADPDRWLSDLRQSTDGRWAFWSGSNPSRHVSSQLPEPPTSDHWPVKVTIHSVDYRSMTLTGTMSASHIPDKSSSFHETVPEQPGIQTSMSSFFTGEIIDFRQQPLETELEGRNYNVGGLDVDARYWARLGPFREEINKVKNLRGKCRSAYNQDSRLWDAFRKAAAADNENKDLAPDLRHSTTTSNPVQSREPAETEPESNKEAEDDEIMSRSLGSAKWIEEKLGREWILMRWKERCFVTPISSSPSTSPRADNTRTILTTTSGPGVTVGGTNSITSTSWGLTISGFYYIALNRLTGEIDGLYYDPGSQPYQALKMVPEGASTKGLGTATDARPSEGTLNRSIQNGMNCGCGDPQCRDRPGIKKWFPSLEFR
ncbi:uncharacterized protein A1O9_06513 [Exophiala aquamarina CBS 119918]|uniref:Post-SET domain-containing protein n=1 Tax=Exophiala aquamarina CBS 119918 TaxID=1182545 RepID=A0A072PFP5_9EURO|nr:uncharacterized protein A1O9_06513 [Exophiala aquamarina CBS 119918]KEF58587.1 hypothetical protein A1O9_06513 [Exophiala aquamarina CBS 119918]